VLDVHRPPPATVPSAGRHVFLTSPLVPGLLLVAALWGVVDADPADVVRSAERVAHLAAMKRRTDEPPALAPMTMADLFALPRPPRAQLAEVIAPEGRGVSVTGFVARVDPKRDGDFHIQITAQPPRRCLRHTADEIQSCNFR
jgi:hypothetical protein